MNAHRLKAYFFLLLTAVIWGAAGPIIKYTLGGIDPLPFLTYRFFLSAVVAIASFILVGFQVPNLKKNFLLLLVYSFLTSTGALGLLFWGMDKTTSLEAVLISTLMPLIVTAAGYYFLRERVTKKERWGTLVALIGTLVITAEPLIFNGGNVSKFSGNLLIIAYIVVNTLSVIILKKLLRGGASPLGLANWSFLVGFITILPITWFISGPASLIAIKNLPLNYHLGVIYMALISGTLAYALGNIGQRTIEVSEASLFTYLNPIFAAPLSIFWLHEKITLPFVVGAIIIALGVAIAEIKKKRYNQASEQA